MEVVERIATQVRHELRGERRQFIERTDRDPIVHASAETIPLWTKQPPGFVLQHESHHGLVRGQLAVDRCDIDPGPEGEIFPREIEIGCAFVNDDLFAVDFCGVKLRPADLGEFVPDAAQLRLVSRKGRFRRR